MIVLIMFFLILGRVFVSYVEGSTDEVVAHLSEILGVPVAVDSIDTEWHGLGPSLVLNGVSLGEGEDLSTVAMLAVRPDVISSLRNQALVWSRFEAVGLDIDIDELASGHWQVAGIEFEGASGASGFLEKMLLDSRHVSVRDAQLHFTSLSGTNVGLRLHDLSLANALGFHRLQLGADFGNGKNRLNFIAELNGSAVRFAELDGLAHLQMTGEDITGLYNFFRNKFWPESLFELTAEPSMHAELWATLRAGQEIQVQGELRFDQVPGTIVGLDSGMAQAYTSLVGLYSEERLHADLINPTIRMDESEVALPDLRLSRQISDQTVAYGLQLPSVNVGRLIESAGEVGIVPESLLVQLSELEPRGLVERLYLEVPAGNPQGWSLTADLQSFGMNSFRQAPAVRNLTGRLGVDHFGGRVEIDATDFRILYPQVYDHWLEHRSIKGQVAWEIDAENRFVHVFSDHIEADSVEGAVTGAFLADIPMFPDYPPGVGLTLYLGLVDSGAEHVSGLLPTRLPENLQDWLNQSLVSGTVPEAGMIYRGSTRPGTEEHRTVQLHIKTESAELDFLPRWPALVEADADIWISNTDLYVHSPSARILDLDIADADIRVDAPPAMQVEGGPTARQIRISAQASGDANSALDLIRTTNLRDQVGGGLDVLDFQGDVEAVVELAMPISGELQRQDVQANIDVSLAGNHLDIAGLDISISEINGLLGYGTRGLYTEAMSARIWDSLLSLDIRENVDDAHVYIEAEAELEAQAITDWLGLDLDSRVSGSSQVSGMLEISTDISAEKAHVFEFSSDMMGVDVDLPAPLAKSADVEAPVLVRLEKSDQLATRIEWQLPATANGDQPDLLLMETVSNKQSGGMQSASFAFGTFLPSQQRGTALANIQLSSLELKPWIELFGGNEGIVESGYGSIMGLQPEITLGVGNLSIGSNDFGQVSTFLEFQNNAWNISLETDYANGTYQYFQDSELLPLLSLEQIDVDAYLEHANFSLSGGNTTEKEVPIDPRSLPGMQFELQSVVYGEKERGHWKGEFRPTETGLWIDNLEGGLGSAVLARDEGASSIFWGVDTHGQYTETNITFEYEDIGDLFRILGMTPPLNSSSGLFYASLHWQGAPFQFSDSGLSGIMGIDATEGEFFTRSNSVNPLIKTIGLFNAGAWTRRLRLDFKDVTAQGTYFDRVVGDFVVEENLVTTLTPVTVSMSSGSIQFDGQVDLDLEVVDARLVVTLPARQNMAWVTALVGGLPAAAGVWLASMIFDEELDSLSSVSYRVTGPMDDPDVGAERIFNSTISN